jgi:hypothetical protein
MWFMDKSSIRKLHENALRCRQLAESASDANVAEVLRETAADIEAAIPILQEFLCRNSEVASTQQ